MYTKSTGYCVIEVLLQLVTDDPGHVELTRYLERLKANLHEYFKTHYYNKHVAPSQLSTPLATPCTASSSRSPQKIFIPRSSYKHKARVIGDELEEYFNHAITGGFRIHNTSLAFVFSLFHHFYLDIPVLNIHF